MHQFSTKDNLNCGDTWPVGSFRLGEADELVEILLQNVDIPCWPELTGLGEKEELVGFWLDLFKNWDREGVSPAIIEEALRARPGVDCVLQKFSQSPLPFLKGQMIGPVTLAWALKRDSYPVIDRNRILEFIQVAFQIQGYLLSTASYQVIISLDEPCAFMESTADLIWEDLLMNSDFTSQFGRALHCCGPPSKKWLELPWNVIHFSWPELREVMMQDLSGWKEAWKDFFIRQGWLALGLVGSSSLVDRETIDEDYDDFEETFSEIGFDQIILSTSCGLDARSIEGTKSKLSQLATVSDKFMQARQGH